MKKKYLIFTLFMALALFACNDDPTESGPVPEINSELRGLEDDFYDIFRHSIYQEMPENLAQENAFKTVFAAAVSQFFVEPKYGMWDVYAPIRVCWDLSDELYLQNGNSTTYFNMEPAEMINQWSGVSARDLSGNDRFQLTYPYMVRKIYEPYLSMFHSVPAMFKDMEFQRFSIIHEGANYDPSYLTAQCDFLSDKINALLEFRDPAIISYLRPFDNCFSMADGCQGLINSDRSGRIIFTALQKALEAMMGIDNHYDRIAYANQTILNMSMWLNENIPIIEYDDEYKLAGAINVAACAATFWKSFYGMETGNEEKEYPEIIISFRDRRIIPAEGGEVRLFVVCNYPWTLYRNDTEGVMLSQEFGDAGYTPITITIPPNPDDTNRVIYIQLRYGHDDLLRGHRFSISQRRT